MLEQFPALVKNLDLAAIESLDECARQATEIQIMEMTPFQRGFLIAKAVRRLEQLITPAMMADVMALQGSPLGFLTDKDPTDKHPDWKGYDEETVKRVLIEATIRGFRPVGNEFNIIGKRLYVAKNGWRRRVAEWPGVTNTRARLFVPRPREGYTVVPAIAEWRLDGVRQTLDCRGEESIPVRVNEGMIVDAILGKAEAKLWHRVMDFLAGQTGEPDPEDTPAEEAGEPVQEGPPPDPLGPAVREYLARMETVATPDALRRLIREAGEDQRLPRPSKKLVMDAATEKRRELDRLKHGGQEAQAQQRKLMDTPAKSATEGGL